MQQLTQKHLRQMYHPSSSSVQLTLYEKGTAPELQPLRLCISMAPSHAVAWFDTLLRSPALLPQLTKKDDFVPISNAFRLQLALPISEQMEQSHIVKTSSFQPPPRGLALIPKPQQAAVFLQCLQQCAIFMFEVVPVPGVPALVHTMIHRLQRYFSNDCLCHFDFTSLTHGFCTDLIDLFFDAVEAGGLAASQQQHMQTGLHIWIMYLSFLLTRWFAYREAVPKDIDLHFRRRSQAAAHIVKRLHAGTPYFEPLANSACCCVVLEALRWATQAREGMHMHWALATLFWTRRRTVGTLSAAMMPLAKEERHTCMAYVMLATLRYPAHMMKLTSNEEQEEQEEQEDEKKGNQVSEVPFCHDAFVKAADALVGKEEMPTFLEETLFPMFRSWKVAPSILTPALSDVGVLHVIRVLHRAVMPLLQHANELVSLAFLKSFRCFSFALFSIQELGMHPWDHSALRSILKSSFLTECFQEECGTFTNEDGIVQRYRELATSFSKCETSISLSALLLPLAVVCWNPQERKRSHGQEQPSDDSSSHSKQRRRVSFDANNMSSIH